MLPGHSPLPHITSDDNLGKSGLQSEGEIYLPGLDWGWLLGEVKRDSNLYCLFSDMSQPRVGLF